MFSYVFYARLFAGLTIIIAWGLTNSPLLGVSFVLVITALSAARYRFVGYKRVFAVFEVLACAAFAFFWFPALLGLWLPVIGMLEDKWKESERELLRLDFEDRQARLRLENEHEKARFAAKTAAHIAKVNERGRIAQELHDHVGHEVTGALIALQTTKTLYEAQDKRAGELINQSIKRLHEAQEKLRDTVHNLKPAVREGGAAVLEALCEDFTFCDIECTISQDIDQSAADTFAGILKEALTNIVRHSNATRVKVSVTGNADFTRLCVQDNGAAGGTTSAGGANAKKPERQHRASGLGISGMKSRARAAGGTLTISRTGAAGGFQVVCVLPREQR